MRSVVQANAHVPLSLIVILIGGVYAAVAQPRNGVELNEIAFSFATELVNEGQVVADAKGAWTKHRPSVAQENEFIHVHGFAEYAKWHLGVDRRFPENSKGRYKFPYGNFKDVHRCALLAVKARARQYGYAEIERAAAELEKAIKKP